MRVRFSVPSRRDLRDIAQYIARGDRSRAISFVIELEKKAVETGENPLAFPIYPPRAREGVRRRVVRNYLNIYRSDADAVVILRILRGARDLSRIHFKDPS